MKTTLQRSKLQVLKDILIKLEDNFMGDFDPEFAFLAMKNVESIEKELALIDKTPGLAVPEGFQEYEQARIGLVTENAEKDEATGRPLTDENGNAKFSAEGMNKFRGEFIVLQERFSDLLEEVDKVHTARADFMKNESEIDLYMIPKASLPKVKSEGKQAGWTIHVLSTLSPIIKFE